MKIMFVVNMEDLGFEEPIGVLYLSAVCKRHGHEVSVAENDISKIEEKIGNFSPDLLAVSVLTPSFPYLLKTIEAVKAKYNIPTVFGGPHSTFFPEIINETAIDFVFKGECEEAFVEFLDLLEGQRSPYSAYNLVFLDENGKIRENPMKRLIDDLDVLPFPDRELFVQHDQFYKADVRSIMASRGCPYHCSYCFNNTYRKLYEGLGKTIRVRSVDNVVTECLELKQKYGAKMLHFFDDIFPYDRDWIEQFATEYGKRVGLPFLTNTSFNVCKEHYVSCLSKAGCKTLLIGVETGNEWLRERVLFRKMSNKMMIERCKLIHSYGIKVYTQNLIGIPKGNLEMDLETLRLNMALKADYAGAYMCQPYPRTAIEKIAREANLIDESEGFERSFYYSSRLLIDNKEQIENLRVLFPIIVNFPVLYNFLGLFLKWPMLLFRIIGTLLHGYKIKSSILIYPMSFSVFLRNIGYYVSRRINRI